MDPLIEQRLENLNCGSITIYPDSVGAELSELIIETITEFSSQGVAPDSLEWELLDFQAKHLAEEIYLAHYRYNDNLVDGVIALIDCVVGNDPEKAQVKQLITRQIRESSENPILDAGEFIELMTNGPFSGDYLHKSPSDGIGGVVQLPEKCSGVHHWGYAW